MKQIYPKQCRDNDNLHMLHRPLLKSSIILFSLSLLNLAYAIPTPSPSIHPINVTSSAHPLTTADDKVVLNFEHADIQTVIKAISKLSGKNFVIDPRVKGTVNIVSDQPISKANSYKVLEAALRMQGFATVEADNVIKVLPETDAKTYGMKTNSMGKNPGDQLITKVFTLDSGSATQLANTLRPMVSPNNSISVYPNSNSLVVTDYASNLTRITKIIHDLRVTKVNAVPPAVIHLKSASAADVAQSLQTYLGQQNSSSGGGGAVNNDNGPSASITVDADSNSLIISSPIASKIEDLGNIAKVMDDAATQDNSNLHVVFLKNADAAHVAEILNIVVSGRSVADITASPASRALADTSSAFQDSNGGGGGSSSSGGGGGAVSQSRPVAQSTANSTSGKNSDKNAPKVLVQAEPTLNALIIQAPEQVYRNLRMVIELLDVRRVQVMIEALVADIATSEGGTFGVQWIGGLGNNNLGVGVVSNYAGNNSNASSLITSGMAMAQGANGSTSGLTSVPQIPGEVYVGLVTGTTTVGGQAVPTISALADMLASNGANNVLARPTLLTLDNEEASLFIGSNIGIPSGSFQNSAAQPGSISNTVNRQDVGTSLRIKPLVTQSGAIQLSVYEEDSTTDTANVSDSVLETNGPDFNKRNIKTQILVDNGQIIALGGITNDQISMTSNGIPLLSSIPYLGWLFSWQERTHRKENLVIFLRPVIIRNKEGYQALTNQRYSYILGEENMIQAKGNLLFPKIEPVTLDNQVPYDSKVSSQKPTVADVPIVDVGADSSSTNKTTSQSTLNTP